MAALIQKDLVRYAARKGVNFFQDSFYNQGFTDASLEPWEQHKHDIDPTRKILIKSSFLLDSVQVFSKSKERIVFGSDAEYAEIHNNGGTVKISITEKSRKYFWFMYKATGKGMWKALALTKKESLLIKIPKRQFIGESSTLLNQLDDWLVKTIQNRFKALK